MEKIMNLAELIVLLITIALVIIGWAWMQTKQQKWPAWFLIISYILMIISTFIYFQNNWLMTIIIFIISTIIGFSVAMKKSKIGEEI
ncbi:MAG: hypothetical protein WC545_01935 [Patescibacteria group bacterium]